MLNRSAAVVRYGVNTAFYVVMRPMREPAPLTREEYLDVLDSVDIPLTLIPLLKMILRKPCGILDITGDHFQRDPL